MLRNSIIILLLSVSMTAFAQDKQVNIDSKISNVTVFRSGAQVHRQTESVDVSNGITTFVFQGLSNDLEAQSIQAKGEGNFTILSVTQQRNFLTEKANSAQIDQYQKRIDDTNEQISMVQNEKEAYIQEEQMLIKNQQVTGPNVSYDLVKLKQALDFQKQRLVDAKSKQLALDKQIRTLQLELGKYTRQINEIRGKVIPNSNDILVKVSSKIATKGKFTLTYMVKSASWYPTYDMRVKDIASPIELAYKANVTQSSGEDWKHIKLILSSGNPTVESVKPELGAYSLGFKNDGFYNTSAVNLSSKLTKGRVTDVAGVALSGVSILANGQAVGTTDSNGSFNLQTQQGLNTLEFRYIGYESNIVPINSNLMNVRLTESTNALNEVVVTGYESSLQGKASGIQIRGISSVPAKVKKSVPLEVSAVEKQTNIVFDIQNPYTVLSDGKQFAVEISAYDIKAEYEYYTVPKISEQAFLTTRIADFNQMNLITGEANIFFEGTYLGKTLIDIQNVEDTIKISLGVDKNVVVKREKKTDFSQKQLIGSSQKDSRHFVIEVKNRKAQSVNLIVEDQLPVSVSGDITVEKQDISQGKLDDQTGKVMWQMKLNPNEQKQLNLKYQVKYPKNRPINLE